MVANLVMGKERQMNFNDNLLIMLQSTELDETGKKLFRYIANAYKLSVLYKYGLILEQPKIYYDDFAIEQQSGLVRDFSIDYVLADLEFVLNHREQVTLPTLPIAEDYLSIGRHLNSKIEREYHEEIAMNKPQLSLPHTLLAKRLNHIEIMLGIKQHSEYQNKQFKINLFSEYETRNLLSATELRKIWNKYLPLYKIKTDYDSFLQGKMSSEWNPTVEITTLKKLHGLKDWELERY